MKVYNLLIGKVELSNTNLRIIDQKLGHLIKSKVISAIAAIYIFERIISRLEKDQLITWDWIVLTIIYIPLSTAIIYWVYIEFIKHNWTNKIKVSNITKITQTLDEDDPLNISLEIKGKFSTLDIDFRVSENEHKRFLEHIKKLNSTYKFVDERI